MTMMPFGRYKGTPLSELEFGYVAWLQTKIDEWRDPFRQALLDEIKRRDAAPPVVTEPVMIDAEALIAAGVRSLSQRHAGDHAAMKQVQSAAARLRKLVAPPRASVLDAPHPDVPF